MTADGGPGPGADRPAPGPAPGPGADSQQQQRRQHGDVGGPPRTLRDIARSAGARALGGGLPGSAAMVVQVLSLMWLRTTVQFQYRTGAGTRAAMRALWADGGVRRFYRGVGPALLQGPLARFGDTAANAGVLALLCEFEATAQLPLGIKTAAASAAAGTWRMLLLPIDAAKTMMQVEGAAGLRHLGAKVAAGGPGVLYHGAFASAAATFVGHYPWFTTFNYLSSVLPVPSELHLQLLRSAGIGFCAGVTSDVVSNSVRVIKTTRQTARQAMSYREAVRSVVSQDGVAGLFTRGLGTRVVANGLQSVMFTMLWQLGQDKLAASGWMERMGSSRRHGEKQQQQQRQEEQERPQQRQPQP